MSSRNSSTNAYFPADGLRASSSSRVGAASEDPDTSTPLSDDLNTNTAPPDDKDDSTATHQSTAGPLATAVTIACNIMGGALLVLPTSYAEASVVLGILLTVAFGTGSALSTKMLTRCAEHSQRYSFKSLCQSVIPQEHARLERIVDFILLLYTYGVLVEYGRIVEDSMPSVVADLFHVSSERWYTSAWFWLIIACIIFFPLTSLQALAELKWTAVLGVLTVVYALLLVIVYFFIGNYREEGAENGGSLVTSDLSWITIKVDIFKTVPVLSVACGCHYNIPSYYRELEGRSPAQWNRVLLYVYPFLIAFYTAAGVMGYLTFGDARIAATQGNIMNAYSVNDLPVVICRLGLFLHFLTAYPIVALGCRNTLNEVLFQSPRKATWIHIVEAFLLVATSGAIAYGVPGIDSVVSIIGSLFAVSIVYTIPSLIYIGTYKELPWREHFNIFSRARWSAAKDTLLNQYNQQDEGDDFIGADGIPYSGYGSMDPAFIQFSDGSIIQQKPAATSVSLDRYLYILAHIYIPLGLTLSTISFAVAVIKIV